MGNGKTISIAADVIILCSIILYFFLFSFKVTLKGKIIVTDETMPTYASIMNDEICRTCLFYHMKDLGVESLYIDFDIK